MPAIGYSASCKMLSSDVAGFTTHESGQVLLVSVHNNIYPVTEYVLHRVFDPYGYVEKIDILRSSEPLQAIVRFDSCQNAVSAKNELQGRYIYDRCCQVDIQFYKKNDYEDKTENTLMDNEFSSDLDFIRNKLHEMMVIIERMQDRMKTMNSSRSDVATLVLTPPLSLPATVTSTTTADPPPSKSAIPFFPLYDTSDPAPLTNKTKTVNPKLKPNPSPQSLDLGKLTLHLIPQESMVSPYLQPCPNLLANPIINVDKPSENATIRSRASPITGSHNFSSAMETKIPTQANALILTDLSIASSNSICALLAPRPELISKQSIAEEAGMINANYVDHKLNFGDRSARVERIEMPDVVEGSKQYNSFSVTAFEYYHNSTFRLSGSIPYVTFHGENGSHKQTDVFALGWNGEDKIVLTFDPGGDKHDAKGSLHVLNHASDPKAMWLSTLFNDHQPTSVIVEDEKKMENNGLSYKNYKTFLMGLIQYGTSLLVHTIIGSGVGMMRNYCLELLMDRIECKTKAIESKFLVLDPGGISHGKINYADKLCGAIFRKYEHNLNGLILEKNGKKAFEMAVFVFDPGGVLRMSKLVLLKEHSVIVFNLKCKVPFS